MNTSTASTSAAGGSVSVGHGPGTRGNEGTSPDRGTGASDSNLTEIDPTQEPGADGTPGGTGRRPDGAKPSGPGRPAQVRNPGGFA